MKTAKTASVLPGHSPGHVNCPGCEANRRKVAPPEEFALLLFPEAARIWLDEHRSEIAPKTLEGYEYYLRSLTKFFAELPLKDIHIGHLESYQEFRRTPWVDDDGREWKAGASCINHELNTLKQILGRAELWSALAPRYRQLPQPKSRVGQALQDTEAEQRLFDAAASNPRWKLAYWASLLTANTGAGPNEIRHLRLCDLNLDSKPPFICIRMGLKNEYRERVLPLNDSALWAVRQILKRAKRIGACEPEHFLMPHRARQGGDGWGFTRPIGSWKKAWWGLRKAAGMPTLRMYDLRHHALTKLYEQADVAEQVSVEIAGHEDTKMKMTYGHARLKVKHKALRAIEVKPGAPHQSETPFGPAEAGPETPQTPEQNLPKMPPQRVASPAASRPQWVQ
jgi:integrase